MIRKFKKKPVVIEAMQYTGNAVEIFNFTDKTATLNEDHTMTIPTLEGDHIASLNDWIIKGVKGEFYPCKPDIFEMTYEPFDPSPACDFKSDGKRCSKRMHHEGAHTMFESY